MTRRRVREIGRHYAGHAGGNEFAVKTIVSDGAAANTHCLKPCPQCPWRKDNPTGAFPPEAYRLSAKTAYDMAQTTFACHMAKDSPATCAGFMLNGSAHNMLVRIGQINGRIDFRRISDGGFALYESYRAMAEANGVAPDDPALAPCRSNDG